MDPYVIHALLSARAESAPLGPEPRFAEGDRVIHRNDPKVPGTVRTVIPQPRPGYLYSVEWSDGYTFNYPARVLKLAPEEE